MTQTLEQAISTFDRAAAARRREAAEAVRHEFVQRFPESAWPTMPLGRYALGQDDGEETFSKWIEFKSVDLGSVAGGSARKHVIYKRRNETGWHYPATFVSENDAWEHLRAAVVEMLALAHEGRWSEISSLMPFRFARAIWLKTLHLYLPDEVLSVYSMAHLAHFWYRLTGEPTNSALQMSPVDLNRGLLARLRDVAGLASLSSLELSHFLYYWDDPRGSKAIYKIAPGEGAKLWDECLAGGYVCVGWKELGDLLAYDEFGEFESRFREIHIQKHGDSAGEKAVATKKAKEVWTLTSIEPGDLILANHGTSRILAVGEVLDPPYEWKDGRDFPHLIHVKWDTSRATAIPPQKRWAFQTIAPVKLEDFERMFSGASGPNDGTSPVPRVAVTDPALAELADRLEERKQLVLYGPPGTGKTYTARRFVLHWLLTHEGRAPAEVLANPTKFREEWARLTKPGDNHVAGVTMLTFHPSYGYEDFVEGFRPVPSAGGSLNLELQDGVFKRVCRAAEAAADSRFVVFIDELNRGNLPRILGELITVLEADKRGTHVVLPQSRQAFTVPPNVYIVGTMNTADRSIKVLDAAIRRRFAFREVMPDATLLTGQRFGDLDLEDFLTYLNGVIARKVGREKQIGHSVFLVDDEPVSDPDEFAKRMRFEVIPLLQEYCYEDYGVLAEFLGTDLVDVEAQALKVEALQQPDALVAALARVVGGGVKR